MGLPEKEYFNFDELAQRWKTTKNNICYYVKHGMLEGQIWVGSYIAEVGKVRSFDGKQLYECLGPSNIKGYMILDPDDVHRAHMNVSTEIRCFKSQDKNIIYTVPAQFPAILITVDHVRVHKSERDRFEQTYDLANISIDEEGMPPLLSYPGRPSVMHKIAREFNARVGLKLVKTTLMDEARHLREWIIEEEPAIQPPTERTIANALRIAYHAAGIKKVSKKRCTKSTKKHAIANMILYIAPFVDQLSDCFSVFASV